MNSLLRCIILTAIVTFVAVGCSSENSPPSPELQRKLSSLQSKMQKLFSDYEATKAKGNPVVTDEVKNNMMLEIAKLQANSIEIEFPIETLTKEYVSIPVWKDGGRVTVSIAPNSTGFSTSYRFYVGKDFDEKYYRTLTKDSLVSVIGKIEKAEFEKEGLLGGMNRVSLSIVDLKLVPK